MKTFTHTCSVVLELAGYLGRLQTCPVFLPYTPSTGIAGMCHRIQLDKRFWWLFSILEKRTTKYLLSALLLCVSVLSHGGFIMLLLGHKAFLWMWLITYDVLKFQIEATFQEILLEDRFKCIDDSNIVLALGILYLCLIWVCLPYKILQWHTRDKWLWFSDTQLWELLLHLHHKWTSTSLLLGILSRTGS